MNKTIEKISSFFKKDTTEIPNTYFLKLNNIKFSKSSSELLKNIENASDICFSDEDYYEILSFIVSTYLDKPEYVNSLERFLSYNDSFSNKINTQLVLLANAKFTDNNHIVKNNIIIKEIIEKTENNFFYKENDYNDSIIETAINLELLWIIDLFINKNINFNNVPNIKNIFFSIFDKIKKYTKEDIMPQNTLKLFKVLYEKLILNDKEKYIILYESLYCKFKLKSNLYDEMNFNKLTDIKDNNKDSYIYNFFKNLSLDEKRIFLEKDFSDKDRNIITCESIELSVNENNDLFLHVFLSYNSLYDIEPSYLNPFYLYHIFSPDIFFKKNKYNISSLDIVLERDNRFEVAYIFLYLDTLKKLISKEYLNEYDSLREKAKKHIEYYNFNLDECSNEAEEINDNAIRAMISKKTITSTYQSNRIAELIKTLMQSYYMTKLKISDDNIENYYIYTENHLIDFEKKVKEFHNFEDSKLYPWFQKLKDKSGCKKLIKNIKIKENIEQLRALFPNFKEFIDYIEENIYLNDLGSGSFYIPPALLISPPGIGKTFFLNTLSQYVGVTYDMINMESVSAGFHLIGANSQWGSSNPGLVFQTVFKSEYANNILILDEIDKTPQSNYPVDSVLLPLLEEHTAKTFKDEFIQMPIDIRKLIWVATANDINNISAPILSRFEIFHIKPPSFEERKILAQAIYHSQISSNEWGKAFDKKISDDVLDYLCKQDGSSRDLRKVINQALGKAAKRASSKIEIQDLNINNKFEKTELWDEK